ncbi:MAG: RsmD family RNA methyltransferase [Planctomycetota bacterium]|jgi:16S rRNA (guanine966-N2)-methyltransferase
MRILAGKFKNRKLLGPAAKSIARPITGAAKKSLFDKLASRLVGASVLDLYCGTGTLGLEALSRGAERCFFADRDKVALERLRRNIETLGVDERCDIRCGDIPGRLVKWLDELKVPADLAFVDPPYAQTQRWDWPKVTERIFSPLAEKLTSDGLVMLRCSSGIELPDQLDRLVIRWTRKYGGMSIAMYGLSSETGEKREMI